MFLFIGAANAESLSADDMVVSSSGMTWPEARVWCENQGLQMVSIHSDTDNDVAFQACPGIGCWFGLNSIGKDGSHSDAFEWTDGTPRDYTNWKSGQPDNHYGQGNPDEDCACFYDGNEWFDGDCDYPSFYALCYPDTTVLFEEVDTVLGSWRNVGPEGTSFGSGSLPGYCSYTGSGKSTDAAVIGASGIHCFKNINDGISGNSNSWIPSNTGSPHFAGISFESLRIVEGFAVARDNNGVYGDRIGGTKTLQYTTVSNPDHNTADSDWKTVGTSFITYNALRHIYMFSEPVSATGFRIITDSAADCIDELELFEEVETVECVYMTGFGNSAANGHWYYDGDNVYHNDNGLILSFVAYPYYDTGYWAMGYYVGDYSVGYRWGADLFDGCDTPWGCQVWRCRYSNGPYYGYYYSTYPSISDVPEGCVSTNALASLIDSEGLSTDIIVDGDHPPFPGADTVSESGSNGMTMMTSIGAAIGAIFIMVFAVFMVLMMRRKRKAAKSDIMDNVQAVHVPDASVIPMDVLDAAKSTDGVDTLPSV